LVGWNTVVVYKRGANPISHHLAFDKYLIKTIKFNKN
jgi:hypothetical protein